MKKEILDEVIELTQELISIPSTHSRPDGILRCADYIEAWLRKYDIHSIRHTSNGIPTLAVMPQKTLSAEILLNAHFDVVEAENKLLFEPVVRDGKLHGRGAIDDKYGVALSLIIFREHLQNLQAQGLNQSDMRFGLLLSGDEEVGGANGIGALAEQIDGEFFIVLDGGCPDRVITKEKGIIVLQLESHGKAAHAARPWLGENGFDKLINDYLKLKTLFPAENDNHWHKTMVLSQCQTGNGSTNMVPHHATATLDIRYTEFENPDKIIATIKKNVKSTVKVLAKEPVFFGGSSPYLNLLQQSCNEAKFSFEHGASDARYLSGKGIPGVIWGANGDMTQHTAGEYLVIDSLVPLYDRLNGFLHAVEKKDALKAVSTFEKLKN